MPTSLLAGTVKAGGNRDGRLSCVREDERLYAACASVERLRDDR